jgi:hypothetical protein
MTVVRSILAVVAGLVFIFVTHNATDYILESLGIFSPPTVRFDHHMDGDHSRHLPGDLLGDRVVTSRRFLRPPARCCTR